MRDIEHSRATSLWITQAEAREAWADRESLEARLNAEANESRRLRDQLAGAVGEVERLRAGLVEIYREAPVPVARVCDEILDRSGRLLGQIRVEARSRAATDEKRCTCLVGPEIDPDRDCPRHGDSPASREKEAQS